ncbi:hypothetical protein ACFU8W_48965 [Streptomyces sp. NPDC057565]|uniref:hypothetical protein n=1 Tax=Streptomyces sp. NPDC057565 TaxID=3346169 RepID=UPI0036ACE5DD
MVWEIFIEQKNNVHLSHALTTLGDIRRARESQQRALELSAPTSTMACTLLTIDGAACSHHDGDSEEACRHTVAALIGLPDGYRPGLGAAAHRTCTRRSPLSTTGNVPYASCGTSSQPDRIRPTGKWLRRSLADGPGNETGTGPA